jgi:hypothetical protein
MYQWLRLRSSSLGSIGSVAESGAARVDFAAAIV